jgi:hypothetical protein
MLKPNEWKFYIGEKEILADGVYALSTTDNVLDESCWPVWCVVVRTGIVIQQHLMFKGEAYDMPEMVGMTVDEITDWVCEADGTDPQQVSHNIMFMS